MITWMQRHKKWLVITIWISTIAFIGAGAISWGGGGFSFSADKAAQVGDIKISMNEYYTQYQALYNEQMQRSQGDFDEVRAKAMGLPIQALQKLIAQAQLRAFGRDLGLQVSDEEVFELLRHTQAFMVDGVFNDEVYKNAVRSMGLRTDNYEEQLKNDILAQKVFYGFLSMVDSTSKTEELSLALPMGIQDRLEIQILEAPKLTMSDADIKAYWEEHSAQWRSPEKFQLEYIKVLAKDQIASDEEIQKRYETSKGMFADENGNIPPFESIQEEIIDLERKDQAWKGASRSYAPFKDGELKGEIVEIALVNEDFIQAQGVILNTQAIKTLKDSPQGQTLKPIEQDDGYVIIKILSKTPAQPKTYEEARDEAKAELLVHKQAEFLQESAKKQLETFKGVDIGFWSLDSLSQDKIERIAKLGLNAMEFMEVLGQIFRSESKSGFIPLGQKMLLYKITDQKLEKPNATELHSMSAYFKQQVYMILFGEYLNKHYPPKIFMDLD